MGNELVRRISEGAGLRPAGATPRVPARVSRAVDHAAHRGLIAAARVRAAGYVTHVGLNETAILTGLEERLIKQYPVGAARFEVIVDTYAGYVAAEIARFSA